MTASRFRGLVVAWALLNAWWVTLPPSAYASQAVRAAMEHAGHGAMIAWNDTMTYLFMGALLVSAAGLALYLPWARWLFVATTVASVAVASLTGVSVSGPVDGTLGYLITLLQGAILALAFSPPIAGLFATEPGEEEEEEDADEAPRPVSDEPLTTVFETSDAALVPVIHSLLTSAGIEFTTATEPLQDTIAGGRLAGYNPATGSVRFQVRRSDALRAKDVLELGIERGS